MVTGRYEMVSDSDGKCYPWYGAKHEIQTVCGPTELATPVTVHMNDNFYPQVTWYIPVAGRPRHPALTCVHRRQRFLSCLAMTDPDVADACPKVLRVITWSMDVEIEVDPCRPLGQRSRVVGDGRPRREPYVLEDANNNDSVLKNYAMQPPNANSSQTLIWRPIDGGDGNSGNSGSPKVIVKPIKTTVDMQEYLVKTKNHVTILKSVINER